MIQTYKNWSPKLVWYNAKVNLMSDAVYFFAEWISKARSERYKAKQKKMKKLKFWPWRAFDFFPYKCVFFRRSQKVYTRTSFLSFSSFLISFYASPHHQWWSLERRKGNISRINLCAILTALTKWPVFFLYFYNFAYENASVYCVSCYGLPRL